MKYLIPGLLASLLNSLLIADTWTVDDDGKADFEHIQAAFDFASDGDEIVVMPGIYTRDCCDEVVQMRFKSVTLRSSDPTDPAIVEATIIDGENTKRGIVVLGDKGGTDNTVIDGFTIVNGSAAVYGGGIWVTQSSSIIKNCIIENNTAIFGGGLSNNLSATSTVTDCLFRDNVASEQGGGIYNYETNPTLTNCTFEDNFAQYYGGGVYNTNNSDGTLTNCTFTNNSAGSSGGGMRILYSDATLIDCTFEGNTGKTDGGGIFIIGDPTLMNCMFTNNTAQHGGGVYTWGPCGAMLTDCIFTNNTALAQGGGMFNYWSNCYPTLTDCIFNSNTANGYGGGICDKKGAASSLYGCVITENDASDGGGLYIYGSGTMLTDTTVCGNSPNQIIGGYTGDGNTVADTCAFGDCNDNGMPDSVDIDDGTSNDCNGNGIPDECELVDNDCNSNGTPDDCDIAGAMTIPEDAVQWAVEDGGNSHWYEVVSCPSMCEWQDARTEALSRGGDLVSINSAEENAFVYSLIEGNSDVWFHYGGTEFGPYVGAYQDPDASDYSEPAGGWYWVDGTPMTYTAWHANEPSNSCANAPENFVHYLDPGGLWNDINDACHGGLAGYIIEYDSDLSSQDCNDNGIPDECDIVNETSTDLNGNGMPDDCEDLDGDGVPDDMDAFPNDPNEWADTDGDGMGDNEDTAPRGGCCVNTGCFDGTYAQCTAAGGNWLGDGGNCDQCSAVCSSDLNGDGIVDILDLLVLIAAWGVCP